MLSYLGFQPIDKENIVAESEVVKVFKKGEYAGPPDVYIREMLDKLAVLGKAVIAGRGDGFSSNISGTVYVGEDGGNPVLRGRQPPPGECDCHVHLKWDSIRDYALRIGDAFVRPLFYFRV